MENGRAVSPSELKTTEKPVLSVCPERKETKPGEILYVPIHIQDQRGIAEPNADQKVTVRVQGGELLVFGSASPRTEETYDTGCFTTYYGRAMMVIRAEAGKQIVISATDGKQQAQAVIPVKQ